VFEVKISILIDAPYEAQGIDALFKMRILCYFANDCRGIKNPNMSYFSTGESAAFLDHCQRIGGILSQFESVNNGVTKFLLK
jgi:hypothetical protein